MVHYLRVGAQFIETTPLIPNFAIDGEQIGAAMIADSPDEVRVR